MKTLALVIVFAALSTAGSALAGSWSAATHTATPVKVVMHDPGCHWFSVGGKFLTKLAVNGPARLSNYDEATLKVAGPHGTTLARIGKPIMLKRGTYKITMVGQAPDDNHLRLTVR